MDLLTLIQVVLRRWYVTIPVMLATLGVAWWVQTNTPPTYEASGAMLLAGPELEPSRMPFVVADVVGHVARLDDLEVQGELAIGGATFAVIPASPTILTIRAVGDTGEAAVETVGNVVEWLRTEVSASQAGSTIPPDERLEVRTSDPVVVPERQDDGSFQAEGTVLVVDPTAGLENPYRPSAATGRVLEVSVESDSALERISSMTAEDIKYDVGQSNRDAAPILNVTVLGRDPGAVLAAFDVVHRTIDEDLEQRQSRAEVPVSRRVTTELIAAPEIVEDVSPPLERSAAALAAAGMLLAVGLAVLVESVSARRAPSRARRINGIEGQGFEWDPFVPRPASTSDEGAEGKSASAEMRDERSATGSRGGG